MDSSLRPGSTNPYEAPEETLVRLRPHQCIVCKTWVTYYPCGAFLVGQGVCDLCFCDIYDHIESHGALVLSSISEFNRRFALERDRRILRNSQETP